MKNNKVKLVKLKNIYLQKHNSYVRKLILSVKK